MSNSLIFHWRKDFLSCVPCVGTLFIYEIQRTPIANITRWSDQFNIKHQLYKKIVIECHCLKWDYIFFSVKHLAVFQHHLGRTENLFNLTEAYSHIQRQHTLLKAQQVSPTIVYYSWWPNLWGCLSLHTWHKRWENPNFIKFCQLQFVHLNFNLSRMKNIDSCQIGAMCISIKPIDHKAKSRIWEQQMPRPEARVTCHIHHSLVKNIVVFNL